MLKINFPSHSPNLSDTEKDIVNMVAKNVSKQLVEIKKEIETSDAQSTFFQEISVIENSQQESDVFNRGDETADVVDFSNNSFQDNGFILLGELLKFLRESKELSCLMLCRKISNIIVNNNVAKIDTDESVASELCNNEKYYKLLTEFFKSKSLDFKISEKIVVESDIDRLNTLLGGKLIIKH